jgi:hypothetical protein
MDPSSAMLGLRMLIMPFNLAIAVAATIALTYCCYVVLLFVWRALSVAAAITLALRAMGAFHFLYRS